MKQTFRIPCSFALVLALCCRALCAGPAGAAFYRTRDSDDWVRRNLAPQAKYDRAILVGDPDDFPKIIRVPRLDLNFRGGTILVDEYPVSLVYKTLQEAADAARGGDLVAVMPGTYAGFEIGDKPDAADGRYIHFLATGEGGKVVIDRPAQGKDSKWMICLRAAHHVIVDGFNITGATGPGLDPKGPRAGVMIDGDFAGTGRMAHHIVVINNYSHNHAGSGLVATDSHTVLVQNNVFAFSCQEHGACVSRGSDNYCIRTNVFFENAAAGLQCNLDPSASINQLLGHEDLRDYPKGGRAREWALGLLKLTAEKFGENNFPDGRGINFIIDSNVINGNGKRGGGSLNLAGLQDSVIQNNLIYGNLTTGIAEWDNANPYDARLPAPDPKSADDIKSADDLPFWGCRGNLIRNNTIVVNTPDCVAVLLSNGSWGNRLRNNIFLNDVSYSVEVTGTSAYRYDSGYNVLNATKIPVQFIKLADRIDENTRSVLGVTREKIAGEFVKFGDQPWLLVSDSWWKSNPEKPDFRPFQTSKLLHAQGDPQEVPEYDLAGSPRIGADIGAYGAVSPEKK